MTDTQITERDEQQAFLLAYYEDPILCARQVFPHWFPRPMPWFHRGMIAVSLRRTDFLLNFSDETWAEGTCRWTKKKLMKLVRCFTYPLNPQDPNSTRVPIFHVRYKEDGRTPEAIDIVLGQHVLFIIPRGYSKTTIVNFCNTYKVLYKLTKFTVYISEAAAHAKDQLATIRRELSGNERILALWGSLRPDRTDDETWGAESFETRTGVKLVAKGRGAQIRGLNKFGDRPDTIVLDDVEDKESVATEVQREKTLSWMKSDVEQALRRDSQSSIFAVGTLLHPEALLPKLARQKAYTTIQLGAIDPEGEVLWDDGAGLSAKHIQQKKEDFAEVGKLYEFGLEFMSQIRNEDKAKFKRAWFRYQTKRPEDFIARSIHCDPAISNKPGADYFVIAVVGQTADGKKHVCDFYAKQGLPFSEQANLYFDMRLRWNCTTHSVEATAYQAALAQVIRELMFIKAREYGAKAYFEVRETWPRGRKEERVEGIVQPLMAAGYLTFQQIWPELETMLLDWPHGKLDGPDAVAGAIANLESFAALSYGDSTQLEREMSNDYDYEAPCAAGRNEVP